MAAQKHRSSSFAENISGKIFQELVVAYYLFANVMQVEETNEARLKFANAKSISSSQFFGDKSKDADPDSQARLQKFAVCRHFYCMPL